MKKDIVISAMSNYEWKHLKNWFFSLKETGYQGDIAVILYNDPYNVKKKLLENNIIIYEPKGNHYRQYMTFLPEKKSKIRYVLNKLGLYNSKEHIASNPVVVDRFFHMWDFFNNIKQDYDRVISTDIRDIIFQKDPFNWLDDHLGEHLLIASSEGLKYQYETWGIKNNEDSYGKTIAKSMLNNIIINAGVFGGNVKFIKDLCLVNYLMSFGSDVHNPDQAMYNLLLGTELIKDKIKLTTSADTFAAQLGVIMEDRYHKNISEKRPSIKENLVINDRQEIYAIVHQYDRNASLKRYYDNKYAQ